MAHRTVNSKPMKMWIDGRIVAINKFVKLANDEICVDVKEKEVGQNQLEKIVISEEGDEYTAKIKLPMVYYTKLHNLSGFSIKELAERMKININIPKLGQGDAILLNGKCPSSLAVAVSHIHSAVGQIREKNVPLQFTCIPCVNEAIKERFENLKKEIIAMKDEIHGMDESIFISPLKLHLTIDVYALLDQEERTEAIKALSDYKQTLQNIIEANGDLKLDIGTLECMNNNIKKVDVIYAKAKLSDESNITLQKIVNDISEHFYERGLAKKYQDNVKLHMTIINTKYRKNRSSPKSKNRRHSIDATKILEMFKDYKFGECDFDCVHLSHMTLQGADGFYKPLAVIHFNRD